MSTKEVIRFNYGINNQPSMADHYSVWKQLRLQANLLLEEVQELVDACTNEDMTETLDAYCDIKYLNTWLEHLLYSHGCETKKAFAEVCYNNSSKITTSYTYALSSKEQLEFREGGEYFVDETVFEGETLYCVKRQSDGKVMKLKSHERPNLSQYVLDEFK